MEMTKIYDSSAILAVGYDNGLLAIKFQQGKTYYYPNVPEQIFTDLLSAPSNVTHLFHLEVSLSPEHLMHGQFYPK